MVFAYDCQSLHASIDFVLLYDLGLCDLMRYIYHASPSLLFIFFIYFGSARFDCRALKWPDSDCVETVFGTKEKFARSSKKGGEESKKEKKRKER